MKFCRKLNSNDFLRGLKLGLEHKVLDCQKPFSVGCCLITQNFSFKLDLPLLSRVPSLLLLPTAHHLQNHPIVPREAGPLYWFDVTSLFYFACFLFFFNIQMLYLVDLWLNTSRKFRPQLHGDLINFPQTVCHSQPKDLEGNPTLKCTSQ